MPPGGGTKTQQKGAEKPMHAHLGRNLEATDGVCRVIGANNQHHNYAIETTRIQGFTTSPHDVVHHTQLRETMQSATPRGTQTKKNKGQMPTPQHTHQTAVHIHVW